MTPGARIGVVAAVQGDVKIARPGEVGRVVESGESIYLGDEISTDGEGQLQILLKDETVFTIGPNSSIVIDEFVYDPSTQDGVVEATVVKGVFRFITGKIAKKDPKKMKVNLPVGTIGVRGTIVAGKVDGPRSTVVLIGPGQDTDTDARIGSFVLENQVTNPQNGQKETKTTHVKVPGFASEITGNDAPPSPAFRVPDAFVQELTGNFASPPPEKEQKQNSTETKSESSTTQETKSDRNEKSGQPETKNTNTGGTADQGQPSSIKTDDNRRPGGGPNPPGGGTRGSDSGSKPLPSSLSSLQAFGSSGNFRTTDQQRPPQILEKGNIDKIIDETARDTIQETVQEEINKQVPTLITSFEQLNSIPQTGSLQNHFTGSSINTTALISYDIFLDIDFSTGGRSIGGTHSRIETTGSDIGSNTFSITQDFFQSDGPAIFKFLNLTAGTGDGCPTCTADLTVTLKNASTDVQVGDGLSEVAVSATHVVVFKNGSGNEIGRTAATEVELSSRVTGTAAAGSMNV